MLFIISRLGRGSNFLSPLLAAAMGVWAKFFERNKKLCKQLSL